MQCFHKTNIYLVCIQPNDLHLQSLKSLIISKINMYKLQDQIQILLLYIFQILINHF